MTVPSSPSTPSRHRRRSSRKPSNLDLDQDFSSSTSRSANTNGFSPAHSPQTPRSSLHSPVTPRQKHHHQGSISMSPEVGGSGGRPAHGAGGLGSLADELADAWDEEGEEEGSSLTLVDTSQSQVYLDDMHDFGIGGMGMGMATSNALQNVVSNTSLSPPKTKSRKGASKATHKREDSQYDGSDYGNDSDLEDSGGISAGLEAKMAGIEALARRGTESNGGELDGVVKRTVDSLKDLGNQSGVETSATRLITAHTSLSSHLTHQSRTLHTLAHPLLFNTTSLYPPIALVPEDDLDDLIDLIATILESNTLPYPPKPSPLQPIHSLIKSTSDLINNLRTLSDTLHESRQATSSASRRLKTAKELVSEIRREEDEVEEGIRWIEKGEWNDRLATRQCATVCGDVVGGFERECGIWRERLVAMANG